MFSVRNVKIDTNWVQFQTTRHSNCMKCCPRCCSPLCVSITNTIGVVIFTLGSIVILGLMSDKKLFGDSLRLSASVTWSVIWSIPTLVLISVSIGVRKPCFRVTAAVFALIQGLIALNTAFLAIFEVSSEDTLRTHQKWNRLPFYRRRELETKFGCCGYFETSEDPECVAVMHFLQSCDRPINEVYDVIIALPAAFGFFWGFWIIIFSSVTLCVVMPEPGDGYELEQSETLNSQRLFTPSTPAYGYQTQK